MKKRAWGLLSLHLFIRRGHDAFVFHSVAVVSSRDRKESMHAILLIDGACWATWTTRIYPRPISQHPSHYPSMISTHPSNRILYYRASAPSHLQHSPHISLYHLFPFHRPPYHFFPALDELNLILQIAKHVSPFEPSHYVLCLPF